MSDEPKVSIVMPVYNGEEYLAEALDSLLAQTLRDFELICVDDGSTDASSDILNSYAASDERIRIARQANAGVSAARNNGMGQARGEYLIFCDDDDLFAPTMLEEMVEKMDQWNADICVPNGYKLDMADGGRVVKGNYINTKFLPGQECFSPQEAGKYLLNFPTFFIYKMYRLSFVRENGIEFGEQRVEEDALFFTQALLKARRITTVESRLFYYRINAGDSVSDLIYQNDILAGYESMLIVKRMMQEYGMYDDPAFHQSFVNRALTKTVNYRGRAKDFVSLQTLFRKMTQEGGFAELDLVGHDAEYFYNQKRFAELEAMQRSATAEEFLFFLYEDARKTSVAKTRRAKELREEVVGLKRELKAAKRALKSQGEEQRSAKGIARRGKAALRKVVRALHS
ncbi:MAG: glycosyltransferase [Adlercreutzia sp.]|nr:glycosyltransferase [Adlercreutzia sp.]